MVEGIEEIQMGTEAWNVADGFAKLKVFKPMFDCDRCETIALYGTENLEEQIPNEMIAQRRIEGLSRYKDNLKLIFSNSNFIIRKEDRINFENLRRHLDFIDSVLSAVSKIEENQVTHVKTLVINEEHFMKCLNALRKIKEELNTPLNNAGMIFRQTDEMDIDEIMKDLVEGG